MDDRVSFISSACLSLSLPSVSLGFAVLDSLLS